MRTDDTSGYEPDASDRAVSHEGAVAHTARGRRCSTSCGPTSFAIAYRMLGSVSEAEDVVQEALLRVHQSLEAGEDIASPRAFVATITTRLAINELPFGPRPARDATSATGCPSPSSPRAWTTRRGMPRPRTRCRWPCWC